MGFHLPRSLIGLKTRATHQSDNDLKPAESLLVSSLGLIGSLRYFPLFYFKSEMAVVI